VSFRRNQKVPLPHCPSNLPIARIVPFTEFLQVLTVITLMSNEVIAECIMIFGYSASAPRILI
jgi:hypothetical protein